jgi:hypothetical protein
MTEERFIIRTAAGFDVIAGHKLNREPLTRAAADRLAHEPVRAGNPAKSAENPAPKPKPAAPSAPEPAPAGDLRAEPWLSAGGSCGFRIKGSPSW